MAKQVLNSPVLVCLAFFTVASQCQSIRFSPRSFKTLNHTSLPQQKGIARVELTNYRNLNWIGEVLVGTPPQRFRVLFDTGSADFWLPERGMVTKNPANQMDVCKVREFNSTASTTYEKDSVFASESQTNRRKGAKRVLRYGNGLQLTFTSGSEQVQLGGLSVGRQKIALASVISNAPQMDFDGVLGLSFGRRMSTLKAETVFENMIAQKLLESQVFSFNLIRSANCSPSCAHAGELVLGGTDERHYFGRLHYVPLVRTQHWQFQLSKVELRRRQNLDSATENDCEEFNRVEYDTFAAVCEHRSCRAIVSSGATLISGFENQIEQLNSAIGAKLDQKLGVYLLES